MFGSEILKTIKNCQNIIFVCHRYPDADSLGSAGALLSWTESLGKKISLFCSTEFPSSLDFLEYQKYYDYLPSFKKADLLIFLDCADKKQTGLSEEIFSENFFKTVNIDHHASNDLFASLNLVQQKSSTAEIVSELFLQNNLPLNKKIATGLLAGIMTDTGFFGNASTSKRALEISSKLINHGANIRLIVKSFLQRNNLESLRLWGQILSSVEYNERHQIVTVVLPAENNIMSEVFDGLSNFLTKLYEAKIIIVLRELPNNEIKVSLRTVRDNLDLSALAKKFGGGGHRRASGFSVKGKLNKDQNNKWQII